MNRLPSDDRSPDDLRRALVLGQDRGPSRPSPGCLDEDAVAALAEGALAGAARAAALEHVARCGRCRAAVGAVARALGDPAVGRAIAARGQSRTWRLTRLALPAVAAAAVLVMLSWPPPPNGTVITHRAPTITAGAAPAPVAPVGDVLDVRAFRWAPVDGADRYRVTLFDTDGEVLYETETSEPGITLPDSVMLEVGRSYLWKVDARVDFDRWTASDLVEFAITPSRSP